MQALFYLLEFDWSLFPLADVIAQSSAVLKFLHIFNPLSALSYVESLAQRYVIFNKSNVSHRLILSDSMIAPPCTKLEVRNLGLSKSIRQLQCRTLSSQCGLSRAWGSAGGQRSRCVSGHRSAEIRPQYGGGTKRTGAGPAGRVVPGRRTVRGSGHIAVQCCPVSRGPEHRAADNRRR